MKGTKNAIKQSGLLKWLTKTILVFGLITFSGEVLEFGHHNPEPTRTELTEAKTDGFKRTISFKRIVDGLNRTLLHLTRTTVNHIAFLFHQENRIVVKLRSNFEEQPTNEQRSFLIYYSTGSSGEFDTYHLMG